MIRATSNCQKKTFSYIEASAVVSITFVFDEGDNWLIMGSKYGDLLTVIFPVFDVEPDADNKKQGPACAEFLVKVYEAGLPIGLLKSDLGVVKHTSVEKDELLVHTWRDYAIFF